MTRLYVVSEGLTETNFVRDVLAPHVEQRWPARLAVQAPNLRGRCAYAEVKKLIRALLGNPAAEVFVTTMIDLYKLPGDFPGYAECSGHEDARRRVEEMERFISEDVQDRRFIPHLQLHEFEALILTDVLSLAKYYPSRKDELGRLARTVEGDFRSPEEVNRITPPSWRIRTAVPEYQKALFGISAVADLGLEKSPGQVQALRGLASAVGTSVGRLILSCFGNAPLWAYCAAFLPHCRMSENQAVMVRPDSEPNSRAGPSSEFSNFARSSSGCARTTFPHSLREPTANPCSSTMTS